MPRLALFMYAIPGSKRNWALISAQASSSTPVGGVSSTWLVFCFIPASVPAWHPYSMLVATVALVFRNPRREKNVSASVSRKFLAGLSISLMSRVLVLGYRNWHNSSRMYTASSLRMERYDLGDGSQLETKRPHPQ